MSKFADKQFWIDTADRAVATFAQASLAGGLAGAAGILAVDFVQVASVGGLAALVSVLTSIAFRGGASDGKHSSELPTDIQARFDAVDEYRDSL